MEDDKKDFVEYRISSKLDIENALKQAEESAWQHAKDYSMVNGIDLGDDEFTSVYLTLSERYTNSVDYLTFFMTTALLTLKALLENDIIKLKPEGEVLTDDEVMEKIKRVSDILVDSYLWLICGDEITWMRNSELPESITYPFEFDPNEVEHEKETDNGTTE